MEDLNILTKEEVINQGVHFSELWDEYGSDRLLDRPEEDGGQPFTGIAYESDQDGNLIYYCYYEDGFSQGAYVEFYEDGNVKSIQNMKRGRTHGSEKIWRKDGALQLEAIYEYGICVYVREWDEKGMLIQEKLYPTKEDLEMIERQKAWYEAAIKDNR